MFDSVREELQAKITPGRALPRVEIKHEPEASVFATASVQAVAAHYASVPAMRGSASTAAMARAAVAVAAGPKPVRRSETTDLVSAKTSPTLVGFQSKNATIPDWRIEVQNAVQLRKGKRGDSEADVKAVAAPQLRTTGSPAIRAEIVRSPEPVKYAQADSDPRVANAMRRLDESLKASLDAAQKAPSTAASVIPAAKPYKFEVISTNGPSMPPSIRPSTIAKPRLVVPAPVVLKRDTNKLPPISMGFSHSVSSEPVLGVVPDLKLPTETPLEFSEIKRIRIKAEPLESEEGSLSDGVTEDIEDLAHLSTRFGAGLFDMIISAFASLLVLSPVAFTQSQWFTTAGLLTFGGVCAIITFIYMTICLGFYGKTLGMRLFSLELVDAVENEYPTLHQAAVSSSVYLISFVFGGAGFLTVFFNEEKRAVHDLLSGTILVREF